MKKLIKTLLLMLLFISIFPTIKTNAQETGFNAHEGDMVFSSEDGGYRNMPVGGRCDVRFFLDGVDVSDLVTVSDDEVIQYIEGVLYYVGVGEADIVYETYKFHVSVIEGSQGQDTNSYMIEAIYPDSVYCDYSRNVAEEVIDNVRHVTFNLQTNDENSAASTILEISCSLPDGCTIAPDSGTTFENGMTEISTEHSATFSVLDESSAVIEIYTFTLTFNKGGGSGIGNAMIDMNNGYGIGISFENGINNMQCNNSFGNSYSDSDPEGIKDVDYSLTIFLGIYKKDGEDKFIPIGSGETGFNYGNVSDVSFKLDGEYSEPATSTASAFETCGITTTAFTITASYGHDYDISGKMTFTVDSVQYEIGFKAFYKGSMVGTIVLPDSIEIEDINAIFSSYANFKSFVFSELGISQMPDDTIIVKLPNKEFTGEIVVNVNPDDGWGYGIKLMGAGENIFTTTTLYGSIKVVDGLDFVENIKFESMAGYPYAIYPGSIGDYPDKNMGYYADINSVSNCSFAGYDYALYSDKNGYMGASHGCTYDSCTHAIYIDCEDKEIGADNDEFSHDTFVMCQYAVTVKSLPHYISTYSLRFNDETFISNADYDFDVYVGGEYYFMYNFYLGGEGNLRTANYSVNGTNAILYTNPIILSIGNGNAVYGIDPSPGMHSAIIVGSSRPIVGSQFSNLNSLNMLIVGNDGKKLGSWKKGE